MTTIDMFRTKRKEDVWSPYGHEAARRQLLNMRRTQVIIAVLGLALLYALFLGLTLSVEEDAGQGKTTVSQDENKPVRVTVSPGGRPTFMNPRIDAPEGTDAPQPVYEEQSKLLKTIRPFLGLIAPLGAALFLVSRAGSSARGKLAELNLGVYKGAMPYEMHTARAYKQVYTHRQVDAHVFGRQREDFVFGTYLLPPSPEVRRLLGAAQADTAGVTRLNRGGSKPQAKRPLPAQPSRLAQATERLQDAAMARTEALRRDWATRQKIRRLRRERSPGKP